MSNHIREYIITEKPNNKIFKWVVTSGEFCLTEDDFITFWGAQRWIRRQQKTQLKRNLSSVKGKQFKVDTSGELIELSD